ncbi:hypothetical protein DFH09DRAFT_1396360 [Mycena vulgaris]|nr:hypothetical protein DFH09DRAFT_1396360 [Mycena vulgaris]
MSGSGATYYNEELKELLRLLKHFMAAPEKIAADAPGPPNVGYQPPVAQVSDDCEAGLAAVNEIDDSSESGPPLGSLAFDIERDGVDITIPFFRDCLSDEPVPGADEIRSLSTWVGTSGMTASRAKPAARLKFGGEVGELDFQRPSTQWNLRLRKKLEELVIQRTSGDHLTADFASVLPRHKAALSPSSPSRGAGRGSGVGAHNIAALSELWWLQSLEMSVDFFERLPSVKNIVSTRKDLSFMPGYTPFERIGIGGTANLRAGDINAPDASFERKTALAEWQNLTEARPYLQYSTYCGAAILNLVIGRGREGELRSDKNGHRSQCTGNTRLRRQGESSNIKVPPHHNRLPAQIPPDRARPPSTSSSPYNALARTSRGSASISLHLRRARPLLDNADDSPAHTPRCTRYPSRPPRACHRSVQLARAHPCPPPPGSLSDARVIPLPFRNNVPALIRAAYAPRAQISPREEASSTPENDAREGGKDDREKEGGGEGTRTEGGKKKRETVTQDAEKWKMTEHSASSPVLRYIRSRASTYPQHAAQHIHPQRARTECDYDASGCIRPAHRRARRDAQARRGHSPACPHPHAVSAPRTPCTPRPTRRARPRPSTPPPKRARAQIDTEGKTRATDGATRREDARAENEEEESDDHQRAAPDSDVHAARTLTWRIDRHKSTWESGVEERAEGPSSAQEHEQHRIIDQEEKRERGGEAGIEKKKPTAGTAGCGSGSFRQRQDSPRKRPPAIDVDAERSKKDEDRAGVKFSREACKKKEGRKHRKTMDAWSMYQRSAAHPRRCYPGNKDHGRKRTRENGCSVGVRSETVGKGTRRSSAGQRSGACGGRSAIVHVGGHRRKVEEGARRDGSLGLDGNWNSWSVWATTRMRVMLRAGL